MICKPCHCLSYSRSKFATVRGRVASSCRILKTAINSMRSVTLTLNVQLSSQWCSETNVLTFNLGLRSFCKNRYSRSKFRRLLEFISEEFFHIRYDWLVFLAPSEKVLVLIMESSFCFILPIMASYALRISYRDDRLEADNATSLSIYIYMQVCLRSRRSYLKYTSNGNYVLVVLLASKTSKLPDTSKFRSACGKVITWRLCFSPQESAEGSTICPYIGLLTVKIKRDALLWSPASWRHTRKGVHECPLTSSKGLGNI